MTTPKEIMTAWLECFKVHNNQVYVDYGECPTFSAAYNLLFKPYEKKDNDFKFIDYPPTQLRILLVWAALGGMVNNQLIYESTPKGLRIRISSLPSFKTLDSEKMKLSPSTEQEIYDSSDSDHAHRYTYGRHYQDLSHEITCIVQNLDNLFAERTQKWSLS